MVAPEDGRHLLDGLVGIFLTQCGADDLLEVGDGEDPFHHGGVRRDDEVVLIHAHAVVALALQLCYIDLAELPGVFQFYGSVQLRL